MESDSRPEISPYFRVMTLNAQDLFLFMDKHDNSPTHEMSEIKWQLMSSSLLNNKPKEKCLILAQTILEHDTDIVMMTEVGGHESLANFAKFLLKDNYQAFSLPSNSDRGIDLGYLIKKNPLFEVNLTTHTDYPLPYPAQRFSRDVLQLDLKINKKLAAVFLLVHIKSKLDLRKSDFEGRSRRALEIQGLIEIYQKVQAKGVPVLVGGDFNGHAEEKDTEEEFKQLYLKTDLKDIASLANIPDEDRFSYVYFTRGGNRFVQHIDYIFISDTFRHLVVSEECFFPRYKNLQGFPLPIPKRMEQKSQLPSDHYPFLVSLKLFPLA